jgi:hypothetical protein
VVTLSNGTNLSISFRILANEIKLQDEESAHYLETICHFVLRYNSWKLFSCVVLNVFLIFVVELWCRTRCEQPPLQDGLAENIEENFPRFGIFRIRYLKVSWHGVVRTFEDKYVYGHLPQNEIQWRMHIDINQNINQ